MGNSVGQLLREWRVRRRLSQLDFACEADVSTRHLSFLETGRSSPSRDMILHLTERLDISTRFSLHPDGLAPRIANLAEWRAHLLERLRRQAEVTADPVLSDLLEELQDYPAPAFESSVAADEYGGVVIPLRFGTPMGILSVFSTTTVFGTPRDVTLSEIALEYFFPADPETAAALQKMAQRA
jgi:transcriptional regulator with XRE-family HTH domain